jgi:transposase
MYAFHDADYRAAKAAMIAAMDEGVPWQELRAWREGPTYLDDGRHGHPSKLREPVRQWLLETCTQAPTTPSHALQTTIADTFGVSVGVRQINRVRAALGVRTLRPHAPKKR